MRRKNRLRGDPRVKAVFEGEKMCFSKNDQLVFTFEIKPVVDMQNYFFKNPEIQHVDVAAVAGDIVSEMWFEDV